MRLLALLPSVLLVLTPTVRAQGDVGFERDVRPILADRCFACHGPDAERRKRGLRLDTEDGSRLSLQSGRRAVVPGDLSASELIRRIRSDDPEVVMPPPSSKLSLTSGERDVLERWIAGGGRYEQHWAFRPLPERVAVPAVVDDAWCVDPLDRFVLARLQHEALSPTPAASRERWIRRVTLSLTGLPPTPEEIDAFVADGATDPYPTVVDRLLGSVRYAERMAVGWIDAARYADTYGYQSDVHREVWPWRDWVIRAFDQNLPYDDFVRWQLAGDLLPDATGDQQLATTFLRLHRQTNEGGSVEEEYRVEYVADRVETVGTALLGLTIGCAKCHDHKFDPITQHDYYALFALFDDADEAGLYSHFTDAVPTPTLMLTTPEQERAIADADAAVAGAEAALDAAVRGRDADCERWLAEVGDAVEVPGLVGSFDFEALGDGGALANGANAGAPGRTSDRPALVPGVVGRALQLDGEDNASFPNIADFTRNDPFTIGLWVRVGEHHDRAVVWHRSRAWTDAASRGYELLLEDGRPSAALIHFWPGNAIRVVARQPLEVERWTHITVCYDGSSRASGLQILIDGEVVAVDVSRDKLRKNITGGGADALTIGQRFRDNGLRGGAVDELRVFGRALAPLEVRELMDPGAIAAVLAQREDPGSRASLTSVFLAAHDPVAADAREAARAARRARSAVVDPVREIMTMRDDCPEPRVAYRLERGQYDARREPVAPGVPASLPPWPSGVPVDRLGFARWLTEPSHPLTARVVVNRIWQVHFGRGLCATPDDLGTQGMVPSHPDLLDHLARRFVDAGWDLKALHRWIVLSATYRQDSAGDPALCAHDPDNQLLGRGPRFRLAAEAIRDQALSAAGLLVDRVGGPSVKPYQPPGLWREKSGATYVPDQGEGLWRRSLYTYWKRTSPPPAMMTFDIGGREVCSVRRQTTTSPLQALVLMNDPQFVEASRRLAERLVREAADTEARLERLFQIALGRRPAAGEAPLIAELFADERRRFEVEPAAASALLATGASPADQTLDPIDVAAWTIVASVVMVSDEAITSR